MTDRQAVALAIVIWAGAVAARPVPLVLPLSLIAIAGVVSATRRVLPVILGAGLLAMALGASASSGLRPELITGTTMEGVATVVSDPVDVPGGVRADVRLHGRRFRATAREAAGRSFRSALAGERWAVTGSFAAFDPDAAARLASRHLVGRVSLGEARRIDRGSPLARIANDVRDVILRGAQHLPPDRRALFAGIVLGDDRHQDPGEVEDFRAAGLTHLLAVSGQNVAFLITLAGPVLRRLRLATRLGTALGVLVVFGAATRWEPSVLRAVAMASVALLAATMGRAATGARLLAVATAGLVLVDPLLVRSVGFQLSVAACIGLVVLAPRFAARLPEPLAVTLAAQVAVLPVLLPSFGAVPLVAVPANLLAGPAAAPLMMWGVAGGALAGLAPDAIATVVHLPTRLLLAWIAGVARVAAGAPVGWLTVSTALVVFGAASAVACVARRVAPVVATTTAVAVAVAVLPAVFPAGARDEAIGKGDHRLWRVGDDVVVITWGGGPPGDLVAALRLRQVRRIDVLVVGTASRTAAASTRTTLERIPASVVLAPAHHQIAQAYVVEHAIQVRVGALAVHVEPAGSGLATRVTSLHARPGSEDLRHPDPGARDGNPQPNARLVLRQGRVLPLRRFPPARRRAGARRRRSARRRRGEGGARAGGDRARGARTGRTCGRGVA